MSILSTYHDFKVFPIDVWLAWECELCKEEIPHPAHECSQYGYDCTYPNISEEEFMKKKYVHYR